MPLTEVLQSPPGEPLFLHMRRRPNGALASVVRESWITRAARCRTAVERALPDASVELYFNLGSGGRHVFDGMQRAVLPNRRAWVMGPHAAPLLIEKEIADCEIVGVRLETDAAEQLLGVPASELRGRVLDLDLLWGTQVESMRDELAGVADPLQRLDALEILIARRAKTSASRSNGLISAAIAALSANEHQPVADVARALGVSHRRLIATCEQTTGMKPRELQRVARLRRVLRIVHTASRPTWTHIAHACGYYDQAHLSNDFRVLSGITLAEYDATRSSIGRGFARHIAAGA
jgi:AraC-like DNA-binding protein